MSAEAKHRIARLGGLAMSQDRKHMARIGAIGGANGWYLKNNP